VESSGAVPLDTWDRAFSLVEMDEDVVEIWRCVWPLENPGFHRPCGFRAVCNGHQGNCLGAYRQDFTCKALNRDIAQGPERSGSSFHKDPNSTSAWNAVISGTKKWIMFPPNVLPPGDYPLPVVIDPPPCLFGCAVQASASLPICLIHHVERATGSSRWRTLCIISEDCQRLEGLS